MLRHRVIPLVLLDGYSVVKTIRFDERRNQGNPITVARIYNTRHVDELVLLDIDASKEGRKVDSTTIEDVASECFMPLCIGGGLRTCDDIAEVLSKGADKVAINSEALRHPEFLREASAVFGKQCIVVSIDARRRGDGDWGVFSHSGVTSSGGAVAWAKEAEALGAGEILLNSVDRDGVMGGYDVELVRAVVAAVKVPVIAAGGASGPQDCVEVVRAGASAVAAASMFHFTSVTPNDVKQELAAAGFPVRLVQGR